MVFAAADWNEGQKGHTVSGATLGDNIETTMGIPGETPNARCTRIARVPVVVKSRWHAAWSAKPLASQIDGLSANHRSETGTRLLRPDGRFAL